MRTVFLCVAAIALAVPASADAATLSVSGGTLTYSSEPGRRTAIVATVSSGTSVLVVRTISPFYPPENDTDPIVAPGCTPDAGYDPGVAFVCPGVSRIVASTGDLDDSVQVTDFTGPVTVSGGAGDDSLNGGPGSDVVSGDEGADYLSGGAGDDRLDGGDGDDSMNGDAGADRLRGGPGFDIANHAATVDKAAVAITLDDVADDGAPGERDDFGSDVEDVSVYGGFAGNLFTDPRAIPNVTLTGSAPANTLMTDSGDDIVTGGGGNDSISTFAGADTIHVRDGYADRISCGPGTDTVFADALDTFTACENVVVGAIANANEDAPPSIAWSTPAPAKALRANDVNVLEAAAADDHGVAAVRFLDDDRVVCEDTAAPYTCGYQARDQDVGRNTLTLVAVDGAGQTASTQRAVVVSRFRPGVSLSVTPRRDGRFRAAGRVVRPATVRESAGCKGTVTVTVTRGKRTLATRRAQVGKRCTYRVDVRLARSTGRLRFSARFGGNAAFLARSAPARTVRMIG